VIVIYVKTRLLLERLKGTKIRGSMFPLSLFVNSYFTVAKNFKNFLI